MNLGDFKAQIKANLRRGSSLDARIPTFIRQAARWIERNKTLQYMKKYAEVSIDLEVLDSPSFIQLEDTLIKAVYWFRWIAADGTFTYLKNWDPTQFTTAEEGMPRYYWIEGVERIRLTSTPTDNLSGQLYLARYTSWPTADGSEPWLLQNAEDVLEATTMMQVAKYTRDPELLAIWKAIRDEGLVTLYAAEQEWEMANTDLQMVGR